MQTAIFVLLAVLVMCVAPKPDSKVRGITGLKELMIDIPVSFLIVGRINRSEPWGRFMFSLGLIFGLVLIVFGGFFVLLLPS